MKPFLSDLAAADEAAQMQVAPQPRAIVDDFRGDNARLRSSIEALIKLNDAGALVPHGIGGHARCLLAASYHRLATPRGPDMEKLGVIIVVAWLVIMFGSLLYFCQ